MKKLKQIGTGIINILTVVWCFISYRLYYAPILIFIYWQSYVDNILDTQGPYRYFIQYIQHEYGTEKVWEIEERSLFVANHAAILLIVAIIILIINTIINHLNKTNIVLRIEIFILCFISLAMIAYIFFLAAPYVINCYYESQD
ncbi:MAG: hypothetical protein ACI4JW_01590 [Oscillospiraceae bacterium]